MLPKIISDICPVQKIINFSTSSPLLENDSYLRILKQVSITTQASTWISQILYIEMDISHIYYAKYTFQEKIYKNKNKFEILREREREGSCGVVVTVEWVG